jgi:CRISPR-associated endonuclease/helicase Cas3
VYYGNRIRSLQGPRLAKSLVWYGTAQALQTARTDAGLPDRFRHELLSLHLLETSGGIEKQAHDRDLVLHLVASHHGFCRPYPPVVVEEHPEAIAATWRSGDVHGSSDLVHRGVPIHHLDRDVDGRFWRLVRRYGWWGLSYLEAIVRLADHRVSEVEQSGEYR